MEESSAQSRIGPLEREGRRWAEVVAAAWASAVRLLAAHWAEALASVLLLMMAGNMLSVIWRKTITNDEYVHIPAGYYHLVDGTFHLNNEHPPLVKMWAALPLLLIQPDERPAQHLTGINSSESTWAYQADFWSANQNKYPAITFWTRFMMLPLAVALGVLIFIYARRLFNARAALCAVALYSLEPTILAHGRIVHTDIPAALAYLLFFFTLYAYVESPTLRRACLVAVACGVALITKFSMIVLAPVLVCLLVVRVRTAPRRNEGRGRALLDGGLVFLIVLLIINAAYRFQSPPLQEQDVLWVAQKSAPVFGKLMTAFALLSHVLPTYYLFGIYNVLIHNYYGHAASLLGQQSESGWWYYFPVAFALKTTIPFLLLSTVSLLWALWRLLLGREAKLLFLLGPLALYCAVSFTSHINIGIRHFLPAFPLLFIVSGAFLDRVLEVKLLGRIPAILLVALTFTWAGVEALRAYPDYVPYMNELAHARPRWYYLSDSNVEWGDDVPALADYLRARGETRVRAALSGGWGTLNFFGVEYYDLFAPSDRKPPETRYVAIGASFLNGSTVPAGVPGRMTLEARTNYFAAYRERRPEAVFGHSIYLYRVRE